MTRLEHGGDASEMERLYGRPQQGWLDLSTGINPLPYPARLPSSETLGPLPLTSDMDRLCQTAANRYGCRDSSLITPSPGTQALIQWLPHLRQLSRVAIVSPTYNEHGHCWRKAGHRVEEVSNLAATNNSPDVVIVVNPNNPDGHRHDPKELLSLSRDLNKRGGWLIVDEAFCDISPEISLANAAGEPGLILLRSFGKFYGLAGLRLGFALADRALTQRLSESLGPWAVSTPAITVGTDALGDDAWTNDTRQSLQHMADRLDGILMRAGLNVVGGTSLFRLVATDKADTLFNELARQGILVRRFEYNRTWLRFGLPGPEVDWLRFETALGAALATHTPTLKSAHS